MERDMELLVFGHSGAKVLVFPTREGRFFEYEDLRIIQWLTEKINAGHLQLYCVDSTAFETFYCFWAHPKGRMYRHYQYEEYVLNEVLPFMASKNSHPCTISHGCSLGAYYATSIALRHPHLFQKLVAFSGRYDLTLATESFQDLLNGHYDDSVYHHMPTHFLPNISDPIRLDHLRKMDMIFTIGDQDPFLKNNMDLSQQLWDKGIWHRMDTWPGRAHSGYHWRRMAAIYL
jgi:esterase/lipase superfamily enzyme